MDKRGQAAGADPLFHVSDQGSEQGSLFAGFATVKAGGCSALNLVVHEESSLCSFQFAQLAQDWFGIHAVHHGAKADRFHIHTGASEAAVPEVLFDGSLSTRHVSDDVADQRIVSDFNG
jgi:hypothetical protein